MKSLSKKLLLTLSVLIVFSSCGFLGEDKSSKQTFNNSDVKIAVEKFQLSNGLKVLLIKNSKLPIYSYYSYFNVGAINEYEGITGSSHYLEHLLFKGENFFDQGRFDHIIESNGGSSNAYTTNDSTVYYERMPSSSLELMIKVEADRMQKLVLKEKGMKSEREVVLD
jgi:zinc protease